VDLKYVLAEAIEQLLNDHLDLGGTMAVRITKVSNLVFEVKVMQDDNSAPRYFNVRLSEML
jgi:hypothetical protein